MRIEQADVQMVSVAGNTHWVFLELRTDEGLCGVGEGLLGGQEPLLRAAIEQQARPLVGRDALEAAPEPAPLGWEKPLGLPEASARSTVDQALWDLRAQAAGVSLYRLLGPAYRREVPLYANINRGTQPRTPERFAERAAQAVREGFAGVKLAPLDGVSRANLHTAAGREALQRAVERVEAVRAAIGPEPMLMVDCHWRLDLPGALWFADRLEAARLDWLEDVLPYADLEGWARLRAAVRAPLVGGEQARGARDLLPFLERGLWDVVMPDVRFFGGVTDLVALGPLAAQYQVQVAPHNPRGPVGTLASAHAAAATGPFFLLEYQWGECDWRSELVSGGEVIHDGSLHLGDAPGLGAPLAPAVVAAHPYAPQGRQANAPDASML